MVEGKAAESKGLSIKLEYSYRLLNEMQKIPKITFGIIVLNGEPFIKYNLRALYPFAHEIIVAEGASPKAAAIAAPEGHSLDDTLDILRQFKANEDPENKLIIVTAEDDGYPNGFWPGGKNEQSRAYAERTTGEYLWQIDVDEFYKPENMKTILEMLAEHPDINGASFEWIIFWGGFDFIVENLFVLDFYKSNNGGAPRIFKWGKGYKYINHRPPTVVDSIGENLTRGKWLNGKKLASMNIFCYHYSSIFPDNVKQKMAYYGKQEWRNLGNFEKWQSENFKKITKPFRVHHIESYISWINNFNGDHPPEIKNLISEIIEKKINLDLRDNSDVIELLKSNRYRLGTKVLARIGDKLIALRKFSPKTEKALEIILEFIFSPRTR